MRRILITPDIKSLARQYAAELETEKRFKTGKTPKERLLKLVKDLECVFTKSPEVTKSTVERYVKAIYDGYDGLNDLLPSKYESTIEQKLDEIISPAKISEIKVRIKGKEKERPLFDLIVDAMSYSKVQKEIMPRYMRQMGIKTCVYCNAQFAVTASLQDIRPAKKGKYTVKETHIVCYDLDHNKPKSQYPYLCTNFYNLQPSCSSCNRRKNDRPLNFSLYYENEDDNAVPLHFALTHEDLIKFRISNQCQKMKANLCDEGKDMPPTSADTKSLAREFNSMLGIQAIYNEHSDIIEEILWKHKIYSSGLMSALKNQLPTLGLADFDIKRFILGGYYTEEKDFLKRPLSVLKEDIWNQLESGFSDSE